MIEQSIFDTILSSVKLKIDMKKLLGEVITEDQIDGIIDSVINGYSIKLEEVERAKMRTAIEYFTQIKHTEDQVIYDDYDEVRDWYSKLEDKDGWFWKRYKDYLRRTGDLDPVSINKLENDTLIKLMNCLGNPKAKINGKSLRRGLVIGDVQSGKTATYTGLICKAADAGYKVVILLTGITETLRQQTQERIEDGILGYTIRSYGKGKNKLRSSSRVGVGLDNQEFRASAFTSYEDDFKGDVDQVTMSLKSHDSLVLFVVKKNVTVLNKLYKWLIDYNKDMLDDMIHAPMLLIDDEADNASINTSNDKLDPTQTNKAIRQICDSFTNATYVGFTATPFANVFIDPDTTEEMKNSDLFPAHFIYVLPTPSSYIGAKEIFYPNGRCHDSIKFITDIVEPTREELKLDPDKDSRPLYYKHTKYWHGDFPDSLKHSIRCFYIANAIRDLKGDMTQPRTMMINISRFVKVHRHIQEWVQSLYSNDLNEILTNFDDVLRNSGNKLYDSLSGLFDAHYSHCGIQKDKVLAKNVLLKAIEPIQVIVVNSKKDSGKLDYKSNPSLRAIAIGGLSLSRGLTLKGLVTSYFYRNTATFDVLMQMGRWFGYRPGYDDIFQIWTSHESAEWYMDISVATEELKEDIHKMFDDKLTPREFGIKVRDISDDLQITSANKMRNSFQHNETVVFWGGLFETPYANLSVQNNLDNVQLTKKFLQKLETDGFAKSQKKIFGTIRYEEVPCSYISNFLSAINVSLKNMRFDTEHILEFLSDESDGRLKAWDVCVFAGESSDPYDLASGCSIFPMERTLHLKGNHIAFTNKAVLGSPSDGKLCLSHETIKQAQRDYVDEEGKEPSQTYPGVTWFKYVEDRNPCLMIYVVKPKDVDPSTVDMNNPKELETIKDRLLNYKNQLGDEPMVAFGVGFPKNGAQGFSSKVYMVNKVYYKQLLEDSGEGDDDLS